MGIFEKELNVSFNNLFGWKVILKLILKFLLYGLLKKYVWVSLFVKV